MQKLPIGTRLALGFGLLLLLTLLNTGLGKLFPILMSR